jgi:hypothetical protein
VRTAVAAVASPLAARLFRLQEAYWGPITTLAITQSSLGAAVAVSWQRFVGTVLRAVVRAIVAIHFGPNVLVFGCAPRYIFEAESYARGDLRLGWRTQPTPLREFSGFCRRELESSWNGL